MIASFAYLAAIAAANLSAAAFGPGASVINAFVFVGFDLTMRDRLHDAWQGRWEPMSVLIVAGGAISWALNAEVAPIAIASTVAFAASATVDYFVYRVYASRSARIRTTRSNIASSAIDSVVFPTLAFGSLMPLVVIGQFTAKVVGGYLWMLLLDALHLRRHQD